MTSPHPRAAATENGPDGRNIATFRTPTLIIDVDHFTVEILTNK